MFNPTCLGWLQFEERGDILSAGTFTRGLTTAASMGFTAAFDMARGAALSILAIATAVIHFAVMLVFPLLTHKMPRIRKLAPDVQISSG